MTDNSQTYISITGLQLKRPWHAVPFWWYAIRSMIQAKQALGNLHADAKRIHGVQHTLTVWRDQAAMRAFLISGAHRHAMKAFPRIATGKTFGYHSDTVPDWDEVHRLWQQHGVEYGNPNRLTP